MMLKRRELMYYELDNSNKRKEYSMQHLVIFSGGLDSTVLLTKICKENPETKAVHFRYGQKHDDQELSAALKVCTRLGVFMQIIELPFQHWGFKSALLEHGEDIPAGEYTEESLQKTVVPFRNGIMLSIAAGIVASQGKGTIHIGAHAGDHAVYPDCRCGFLYNMSTAISYGTDHKVGLTFPFTKMSKADIVKLGVELHAPMELSYSCYNGGEIHCGECSTCCERKKAFKDAMTQDLTEYKK